MEGAHAQAEQELPPHEVASSVEGLRESSRLRVRAEAALASGSCGAGHC